MSRIISGLKQAIRYARGDKTAGKKTTVMVPGVGVAFISHATLMEMAQAGHGTWVNNEDMHPAQNVYNRVYRLRDGSMHIFYGFDGRVKDIEAWFFPRLG